MHNRTSIENILTEARDAVEGAQIPEDLRRVAFDKAVDLLADSTSAGIAESPDLAGAAASGNGAGTNIGTAASVDTASAEAFVRSQPNVDRPAGAVKAIAAWWFSQYGAAPIARTDVETIANDAGVTIPDRPDATMRGMRHEGREVFRSSGRGALVPTRPHGELFFQTQYSVTKGRNPAPGADQTT